MTDRTKPDIVERLKERRKLKYMGNCKCGKCQLVHIDDVYEAADEIERLHAINVELVEALEWTDRRAGLGPHIHERIRTTIAQTEAAGIKATEEEDQP
jgi:hypothetical protein